MRAGVAAVIFLVLLVPWGRHPGFLAAMLAATPALARDAGAETTADGNMISAIPSRHVWYRAVCRSIT